MVPVRAGRMPTSRAPMRLTAVARSARPEGEEQDFLASVTSQRVPGSPLKKAGQLVVPAGRVAEEALPHIGARVPVKHDGRELRDVVFATMLP